MIDAASIGIRLALDDGVSEGIASIRRDLAAFDRAVGGSSANLLHLRGLVETLGAQSLFWLAETTRTAVAALLPQPRPVPAPSAAVPPDFFSFDTPLRAPTSPIFPQAPPGTPSAAGEPGALPPMAPRDAALRLEEISLLRGRIAAVPPAQLRLPVFADFSPFGRVLAAAPITASHAETPSRPVAAPMLEALAVRAPVAPLPLPLAAPSPVAGHTASSATWPARLPVAPNADLAASIRLVPPEPVELTSSVGRQASNATAKQSEVAEIHIDGYLLGRFVNDHLARAATRPPAGGTGFDPRLSPAWPGPAGGL